MSQPAAASVRATAAPMRFPPVISAARPVRFIYLRAYLISRRNADGASELRERATRRERAGEAASDGACRAVRGAKPLGQSRDYSPDQDDPELQLADFDNQRLVSEVGRVDRQRRVLRRGRIDAPHRGVLAAKRLLREVDQRVVTDNGGILVDRGRRKKQEIAERRHTEMVVRWRLNAVAQRIDAGLHQAAPDVSHVRVQL